MTKKGTILVVDDEPNQRDIIAMILADDGYGVLTAGSGEDALLQYRQEKVDLVISDYKMPGMDGIELVRKLRSIDAGAAVIIMTAHGSIDHAVDAMKQGATDYLPKPFEEIELKLATAKAFATLELKRKVERLQNEVSRQYAFEGIIGQSKPMLEIFDKIRKVQSNTANVLITGASGTGKELVARAIHFGGTRKTGPFVAVNAAAIPQELVESELFGHKKGSFTGAIMDKPGKFTEADGGTLFLDEVGIMAYPAQTKLLRALQEREITPLGSNTATKVDIRVIAATSENLEQRIQAGQFRQDLFYRLNVISLALPKLIDRRNDIPLLVEHFLHKSNRRHSQKIEKIEPAALDLLMKYDWPGNVRELENIVERMVVLSNGATLGVDDLPIEIRQSGGGEKDPGIDLDAGISMDQLEARLIREALDKSGGKLGPAAEMLGITYKTLQYRIKKYHITGYKQTGA